MIRSENKETGMISHSSLFSVPRFMEQLLLYEHWHQAVHIGSVAKLTICVNPQHWISFLPGVLDLISTQA